MFKVKIRSIVDRPGVNPLCCTLRCARSCPRTLFSRTVANTFPGVDIFAVFRTALSFVNRENNSLLPVRWNYSCLPYLLDYVGQPQDPKFPTGFKHLSCYTAQTWGFAILQFLYSSVYFQLRWFLTGLLVFLYSAGRPGQGTEG